jgi:hypothetical protein
LCASIIDKYLNQQNIYEYLSFGEFASYYNMKDNKLSKCRKQKTIRFVNYNKQKIIENWSREQLLLYSPFKNSENSLLGTHVTWDDAYCGIYIYIFRIRSEFNYNIQTKHTNEKYDVTNLHLNFSHLQNIWNDDIDDDIGDTCPLIPITNTLNIEKYDLKNDLKNDFIV